MVGNNTNWAGVPPRRAAVVEKRVVEGRIQEWNSTREEMRVRRHGLQGPQGCGFPRMGAEAGYRQCGGASGTAHHA